ncbi:hypothetical protein [Clostridium sp. DL1XJH146]
MDNNEFEKNLREAIATEEIPELGLMMKTREKIYVKKEEKQEKLIVLYMVTLISILISLEIFACIYIFKINIILGSMIYVTFLSFVALVVFISYSYKNSIIKYLENC